MAFALGPRAKAAGCRVEAFDEIASTNAETLMRAHEGECGPLWLVTAHQTGGHGRRQRPWLAPRGNLAASFLEVMDVTPPVAATLGFVAGLSLEAALGALCARQPAMGRARGLFRLKWPNDVLAGTAKLAGILLEAERIGADALAVVVGIGVNVAAAPEGLPYPATSLADLGLPISAESLFIALGEAWTDHVRIWDRGRGVDEIRRRWLERAAGVGEPVAVRMPGGTVSGTFATIDDQGRLIVTTAEGGRTAISAGDVQFGPAATAAKEGA
ncbi:MAG: biotin--[acetyl-CoA-carboxylase] ligase [Xanthobacteraceae bacterium]|nr:MAG: biotin--[acetyl-CoA-carboxylase] ligase [Xanthobacteraceae bacterium]